MNYTGT